MSTNANYADPVSRGMLPRNLLACPLHLEGPQFLRYDETRWLTVMPIEATLPLENVPDFKRSVQCALHVSETEDNWLLRFSSLSRMQRGIGYCLCFTDRA